MKNYFVLILITLVFASCSQQEFAFRKKIAVNQVDKLTAKSNQIDIDIAIDSAASANVGSETSYIEPSSFVKQQDKLASATITALPDDTIRKKYKFDDDKKQNNQNSDLPNSDPKNANYEVDSKADKDALTGFILSIVGFFIFQPVAIAGLIYSIRGLKSFRRKGLAIAGVIISSLVLLLLLLFIFLLFLIIASFGA